jgi:hypothetical protein
MADIGPVTVFAVGIEDSEGFGAYSCDPSKKCPPTRLTATSKQAKRLTERYQKACASAKSIWLPARENVCSGMPVFDSSVEAPQAQPPAKGPPTKGTIEKKLPAGTQAPSPWPVKE